MTDVAHKDLTGVDLHEPKGIETATSGQVYMADGASSGTWSSLVIPTGLWHVTTKAFTSTGTYTLPSSCFKIRVHCTGSGGSQGVVSSSAGATGGTAAFGSFCSATGGTGGTSGAFDGATTGGSGFSGDFNGQGYPGFASFDSTVSQAYTVGGMAAGPFGLTHGMGQPFGVTKTFTATPAAGGGYSMKEILASAIGPAGTTVTVSIGNSGASNGYVFVEEFISD